MLSVEQYRFLLHVFRQLFQHTLQLFVDADLTACQIINQLAKFIVCHLLHDLLHIGSPEQLRFERRHCLRTGFSPGPGACTDSGLGTRFDSRLYACFDS